MKVTIQYSVDLEEVPNKVRDFLMQAAQKSQTIEAGIKYTISLMNDKMSIEEQLSRIDEVRKQMADIDHTLHDCSNILHGYQKALVQQASSFEDSKCMNPEFIEELVERIVQRVTEKSNHDLEFYTINEVASLLKVSRATVERRIKDEELKTYKFGGNIRIRKRDLMSFLDSASP